MNMHQVFTYVSFIRILAEVLSKFPFVTALSKHFTHNAKFAQIQCSLKSWLAIRHGMESKSLKITLLYRKIMVQQGFNS